MPLRPTITAFSLCLFDRFPNSTKSLHDRPLPLLEVAYSITKATSAPTSPFLKFLPLVGIGFVLGSQLVPNLSGRAAIGVSDDFVEVGNLQTARSSMHHHCTQHTKCISDTHQYHCKYSVKHALVVMMLVFIGDTRQLTALCVFVRCRSLSSDRIIVATARPAPEGTPGRPVFTPNHVTLRHTDERTDTIDDKSATCKSEN